jgi:hypothetical protein
MRRISLASLAAVAAALLLSGCAGDSMDDSSSGQPQAAADVVGVADQPSATARMVCSDEIRENIAHAVGLASPPQPTADWSDQLFRCDYGLASGTLVLSVKQPDTAAAAHQYFDDLRRQLQPTTKLRGLAAFGLPAFEDAAGTVVFYKDAQVLTVDATQLGAATGPHGLSRADLAYEIASDVIGCWSE